MSTNIYISAYHRAGTWRENGQSQSPRPPHRTSALPSGTSETGLVDSSTTVSDHLEYLKSGPRVLPQVVWGMVAEKEQRFNNTQPRVTKSAAYTRRRSLSRIAKHANKVKRLRKKLVSDIEGHDSRNTVEVAEEHTQQPKEAESTEAEHEEDSSTIFCAIDTRLQDNINDSSGQFEKEKESSTDLLDSSNPPTNGDTLSAKTNNNNMSSHSSRSSRHYSSPSSSSIITSKGKRHLSPPRTRSPPPKYPKPEPSSSKSPKDSQKDKEIDDDKDDWHQITEPEHRRRVQNRIAQRKFREKARSLKDQQARDAQNKKYAGCAYTCPEVDDLPLEHDSYEVNPETDVYTDLHTSMDGEAMDGSAEKRADAWISGERESGLPWGGLSMRYMIGRGHEYYQYQTSRGSGSGSRSGTATITSLSPTITALGPPTPLPTGASGGGDAWPSLQHSRAAMEYRRMTSAGNTCSPLSPYGMTMPMGMDLMSGGDMDVDYTIVSGAGGGGAGADTGMEYVTSPSVSMAGVTPGTGMDVTYYDSSPYYYGYGSHGGGGSGGGNAASGSGGSVYGGHGGRHL
ncbi:hypothetical protein B0T20DRAFT_186184 [Sordaria brevicollis]|uniref:BZIP domain-containing protein n=1 Tax=Sordaria brevicollis TaxID=83679 RepID=A0AAE0UD03_SORBR|nr:hypothetical protein B0T20DRAFT_186184 [Sordaria brevicollis]